uniref:(California timema) hypothetical protein n=1 Tax=Timema californicum TaxID=61474 RepID=A0A7R9JA84_TIMCA|nr:unnamed protein product [Timema californicum]
MNKNQAGIRNFTENARLLGTSFNTTGIARVRANNDLHAPCVNKVDLYQTSTRLLPEATGGLEDGSGVALTCNECETPSNNFLTMAVLVSSKEQLQVVKPQSSCADRAVTADAFPRMAMPGIALIGSEVKGASGVHLLKSFDTISFSSPLSEESGLSLVTIGQHYNTGYYYYYYQRNPHLSPEQGRLETVIYSSPMSSLVLTDISQLSSDSQHLGCLGDSQNNTRIIGGRPSSPSEYPFVVSLQKKVNNMHHCGGSIISPIWVLSAAHCMFHWDKMEIPQILPSELLVVAGIMKLDRRNWMSLYNPSRTQIRHPFQIFVHSEFEKATLVNDISLISFRHPFKLVEHVKLVTLPKMQYLSVDLYPKDPCTVVGWGSMSPKRREDAINYNLKPYDITGKKFLLEVRRFPQIKRPNVLQKVSLPLIETERCRELYDRLSVVPYKNLCTYSSNGLDACDVRSTASQTAIIIIVWYRTDGNCTNMFSSGLVFMVKRRSGFESRVAVMSGASPKGFPTIPICWC